MINLEVNIFGHDPIPMNIFGVEFELFRELIYLGVALLAVLLISIIVGHFAAKQDPRKKPSPILIIAEALWDFSYGDIKDLSDENPKHHKMLLHVYATCIFLTIFIANTLSLWGAHSPAANIAISMGLGAMVFILVHGLGIIGGPKEYIKSYFEPFALFLPINIIMVVSDIISISMRLFGNSLASMILAIILKQSIQGIQLLYIGYFAYPIAGSALMLYDIFIAYIQALLFMRLSMTYIKDKVEIHEMKASKAKESAEVVSA